MDWEHIITLAIKYLPVALTFICGLLGTRYARTRKVLRAIVRGLDAATNEGASYTAKDATRIVSETARNAGVDASLDRVVRSERARNIKHARRIGANISLDSKGRPTVGANIEIPF